MEEFFLKLIHVFLDQEIGLLGDGLDEAVVLVDEGGAADHDHELHERLVDQHVCVG